MITVIHDNSYRAVQAIEVARRLEKIPSTKRILITCGLEVVDKAIAAKQPGDILISILDPQKNHEAFDLIFVPRHDPHPNLPNIKTTLGIINHINPDLLASQPQLEFQAKAGREVIAVLIGGRHIGGNFSSNDAAKLANIINKADCTALVTTSKRTEEKAVKTLKAELWKTALFFDYNKDGLAANPYLQILAGADKIITTADSVRMCSESCSSGKPVFIFTPEKLHFSYAALRDSLYKADAAFDVGQLNSAKKTKTLDEAGRVAELIRKLAA